MSNGFEKNIEDILPGDAIMSVDVDSWKVESDTVIAIPKEINKYQIVVAEFSNGVKNEFSPAHPYWVKGKGWAVFDIEEAKKELSFEVDKIELGDTVYHYHQGELIEVVVVELRITDVIVEMYNVEYVKKNHSFFANGILVHNKFIDPNESEEDE